MNYRNCSRSELLEEQKKCQAAFEAMKAKGLSLDMSRGKPGKAQLDAVSDILTVLTDPNDCLIDGMDARNYGGLAGLPCAKALFAEILGCRPEECFIGGSASLTLMYDTIAKAYTHGLLHSEKPWAKLDKVRFLCPAPGYDRHFRITESFGAELITVNMTPTGPDMDVVEELVRDPSVKGIWCVPKYSNPDGIVYSDETIRRFANLKPAAPDFIIMWDNAYVIHDVTDTPDELLNIVEECKKTGNEDLPILFCSTSKITFPGAGVAAMAASPNNMKVFTERYNYEVISYDKLNMLRHVKYFGSYQGVLEHMKKHKAVLQPKFEIVLNALDREIAPTATANWTKPNGGYFVSIDVLGGTAKRVVALCKEAGVVLTGAGATYPLGKDPRDSNIRIAPSFPPNDELEAAMKVFCICVKLAACEKILGK